MGLVWLILVAIGLSAVSLYYYLQVLKQVFVAAPDPAQSGFHARALQTVVVIVLAVIVVLLGCWPEWFVSKLTAATIVVGL